MREDLEIPEPRGGPSYRMVRVSSGMDASTKRLMMIAGGVGGTLALLIGAYSLAGHQKTGVPIVEAAAGPVRVKPANPGGLQVFGADEVLPSDKTDAAAVVAPPPEAPNPQALKAQEKQAAPMPAPTPPPVVAQNAPPPAAVPMPPAPRVEPAPVASPRPLAAARPPVTPAPPPAAVSGTQVQLAALTTEEQAMSEWARLSHKMPDLLASRRPAVSRTEHEGKVWYRLRTGGFGDVAEATSFCQRVREKGAACAIASF